MYSEKSLSLTIVTPTYNQAAFIGQTLQSVLDQNLGPRLQYIIQDACSDDGTEAIIRRYEPLFKEQGVDWLYIREKDDGQADAINRGWARAAGDVVSFLNSDDVYLPGALPCVLRTFEEQPDVAWACGGWRYIGREGQLYQTRQPRAFSRRDLLAYCVLGQPAVFFRRRLLDEIGYLNPALHLAMDYDLWLRISARYQLGMIPAVVADMRYYDAAKSVSAAREQLREVFLLGKAHTRDYSWARVRQRFYYLRGLVVVLLKRDLARRVDRAS